MSEKIRNLMIANFVGMLIWWIFTENVHILNYFIGLLIGQAGCYFLTPQRIENNLSSNKE
jgi:multisubunit Na+/H+ antiporter MnhE subunit